MNFRVKFAKTPVYGAFPDLTCRKAFTSDIKEIGKRDTNDAMTYGFILFFSFFFLLAYSLFFLINATLSPSFSLPFFPNLSLLFLILQFPFFFLPDLLRTRTQDGISITDPPSPSPFYSLHLSAESAFIASLSIAWKDDNSLAKAGMESRADLLVWLTL